MIYNPVVRIDGDGGVETVTCDLGVGGVTYKSAEVIYSDGENLISHTLNLSDFSEPIKIMKNSIFYYMPESSVVMNLFGKIQEIQGHPNWYFVTGPCGIG